MPFGTDKKSAEDPRVFGTQWSIKNNFLMWKLIIYWAQVDILQSLQIYHTVHCSSIMG